MCRPRPTASSAKASWLPPWARAALESKATPTMALLGQFARRQRSSNPTLTATNRNAGSIFRAVSGSAKVLDVGATVLSVIANSATTTVGDVGCDPGFVGITFGSTVNCGTYSLVGNGATTILNHPTG